MFPGLALQRHLFCRFQSHVTVRKVYKNSWKFIYFQDCLFYGVILFFSYTAQVV